MSTRTAMWHSLKPKDLVFLFDKSKSCRIRPTSPLSVSKHLVPAHIPAAIRPFSDSNASEQDLDPFNQSLAPNDGANEGAGRQQTRAQSILESMFSAAMNTIATGAVLAVGGYGYYKYYKNLEFRKMETAFTPGDPVLELASLDDDGEKPSGDWVIRDEQQRIDAIVTGQDVGHYFLIVGEKGTGKTSMILAAMQKINGEGVAMFEAHADPEVVRIRLGRALNFEFKEDYIGGLFSIRGPRDTTALLDIERAFNKLEKVAIKHRRRVGKPLVLIVNSMHLLRDDEEGRDILELIQQRAEQWAASKLVTIVLNSDDYWVYERLKQYATRMQVLQVVDLPKDKAISVLRQMHQRSRNEDTPSAILEQIYYHLGGRLSFLGQVAREPSFERMLQKAEEIRRMEKAWLLSKCWILGTEMDDDVMDEQKYSCAAFVLARALVEKAREMSTYNEVTGHHLPEIPLHEARQVMTRADFLKSYDHINVFTIDSNARVRADSVPMMHAFIEICSQEAFDEHLEKTLDRISAIESLGRTRELLLKGLSQGDKPDFEVQVKNQKGQLEKTFILKQ